MNWFFTFWDLGLWISITAILLLITIEVTSLRYGKIYLTINKKRLRNITYIMLILFILIGLLRLINIMQR